MVDELRIQRGRLKRADSDFKFYDEMVKELSDQQKQIQATLSKMITERSASAGQRLAAREAIERLERERDGE